MATSQTNIQQYVFEKFFLFDIVCEKNWGKNIKEMLDAQVISACSEEITAFETLLSSLS